MSQILRRAALFESLERETFDVAIIGGGINGAGIARDAALRGMRVALIEARDFASGTSSRSSRLIHGGVRYLEHGALRLVFESSRERRTLMRIAPHLVRPLSFTWPVYQGARIPRWKLGAGLALYDALALFRNVQRHHSLDSREVLRREPGLRTAHLTGGASYWDAATDDSRLTLANALDAMDSGAVVVNHAVATGLLREGTRVTGVEVTDAHSAAKVRVVARVVVNATGPWSDTVESMAGMTVPGVRGSKGVHVAVHRSRLGNSSALTLTAPQDGRVMFVLPAGSFTIIGTTDTYEHSSPEDVRASDEDVAYLLHAVNHYFPTALLGREDVVSAWAGIRPLAAHSAQGADPGAASREHAITQSVPGVVRVTGGKLTTYRSMSEEVVDCVERLIGRKHMRCATSKRALPGGGERDIGIVLREATDVVGDPVIAERLVHAYGTCWRDVWALVREDATLGARITPERPYIFAELRYGVEHELARTLGDLLVRRVPIAFETVDHGHRAARRAVELVRGWLGEAPEWDASALEAYDAEVKSMFSIV